MKRRAKNPSGLQSFAHYEVGDALADRAKTVDSGSRPTMGEPMTSVFYSFNYDRDVNRVQLVRNIQALEKQPLLTAQRWEEVERSGKAAIAKWIDENMKDKSAVVVLIGQETAGRPWVIYEIEKAWADMRPLLGVRIHGLSSFGTVDRPGVNPFQKAAVTASSIPVFDPTQTGFGGTIDSQATYNYLAQNLESWVGRGATR
jgi:hypothetical protein